jgi:histone demethylase JARID1
LQREYWRERERRDGPPLWVEYGSDVEGSLFLEQDRLGASRWNLNRLPQEAGCALRLCGSPIPGVSRPMLYVGQLFSTFAWHAEDHFLHSVNYQHLGASKTWWAGSAAGREGN